MPEAWITGELTAFVFKNFCCYFDRTGTQAVATPIRCAAKTSGQWGWSAFGHGRPVLATYRCRSGGTVIGRRAGQQRMSLIEPY